MLCGSGRGAEAIWEAACTRRRANPGQVVILPEQPIRRVGPEGHWEGRGDRAFGSPRTRAIHRRGGSVGRRGSRNGTAAVTKPRLGA